MSYYLEQLQKKGLKLTYSQQAYRNTLKFRSSSIRRNKLNSDMDTLIRRKS